MLESDRAAYRNTQSWHVFVSFNDRSYSETTAQGCKSAANLEFQHSAVAHWSLSRSAEQPKDSTVNYDIRLSQLLLPGNDPPLGPF